MEITDPNTASSCGFQLREVKASARRLRLLAFLVSFTAVMFSSGVFAPPAAAATCGSANIRYAASSYTLYVTGPVTCTLTEIDALTSAPVRLVDAAGKIWYLGVNLKLEKGATLRLHGSEDGGDVDQLRLRSNNSGTGGSFVWIRAQWGNVDIANTQIISWNDATAGPDLESATYKRAYIHVRSYLEADGITPAESRMDISNTDIGYLGFNGSEAYGVAWKVSGSQANRFDRVDVLGDVSNSRFHDNYMGAYTYGAYGMRWSGNEFDHNASYGLDPHDDSDALIIENNNSHHNGNHGIICSQRCDHLQIRNNTSSDNVGNGIMLHRNANDSIVRDNQVLRNTDTGIALFDSHNNSVTGNVVAGNKRGIRLSVGSADNTVEGNDVSSTATALYLYKGSDVPTSGDGHPKRNRFTNNRLHDNAGYVIDSSDSDDNLFADNSMAANAKGFKFTRSRSNRVSGFSLALPSVVENYGTTSSPTSTYIENFASASVKVDGFSKVIAEDSQGTIFDPSENLATQVTSAGSTLTLDAAGIGTTSFVVSRNLRASVVEGSAAVDPKLWETSGALRKQWTASSPQAGQLIAFLAGDLAPNSTYEVLRNGAVVGRYATDSAGQLQFSDNLITTGAVQYEIRP